MQQQRVARGSRSSPAARVRLTVAACAIGVCTASGQVQFPTQPACPPLPPPRLTVHTPPHLPCRYVSCAVGCPYQGRVEPQAAADVAQALHQMGVYEVSMADTTGVGTPASMEAMLKVPTHLPTCLMRGAPPARAAAAWEMAWPPPAPRTALPHVQCASGYGALRGCRRSCWYNCACDMDPA